MTCVAAIAKEGKVYFAGDRAASEGNYIVAIDKPKIWKNGKYIFGFAGTFDAQIIQYNFNPPEPEGNLDKFMHTKFLKYLKGFYAEWDLGGKDSELSLIIGIKGKIYEHEAEGLTMISYDKDYIVIGSGAEYAMGSLHSTRNHKDPKRRLALALDAACDLSNSCLGPVDFLSS